MFFNMRRVFLAVLFSVMAGAGSFTWAAHGHGGGGGHGHGGGGGHGHGGFSGGHGHGGGSGFSGGHGGFNNHWGGWGGGGSHWGGGHWGGGNVRYYSGYHGYRWPYYRSYYWPYFYGSFGYPYYYGYGSYLSGYYGYPNYYYSYPSYYYSYPSDYYVNGDDNYYSDAPPPEYVVSRPVGDVAQLEVRLPDPQGTIWVQGKEMTSSGTVRQFRSPQLDPSQQYTYTVKAEWNNNGKLFSDERQVKVQANALAVVDFTKPAQTAPVAQGPALPALPPPQPRPAD